MREDGSGKRKEAEKQLQNAGFAVEKLNVIASIGNQEGTMVSIYQDGALVKELSLDSDTEVVIEGEYENVVTVKDGKVAITKSDCPGTDLCIAHFHGIGTVLYGKIYSITDVYSIAGN